VTVCAFSCLKSEKTEKEKYTKDLSQKYSERPDVDQKAKKVECPR
jgi:hypothetical protein